MRHLLSNALLDGHASLDGESGSSRSTSPAVVEARPLEEDSQGVLQRIGAGGQLGGFSARDGEPLDERSGDRHAPPA